MNKEQIIKDKERFTRAFNQGYDKAKQDFLKMIDECEEFITYTDNEDECKYKEKEKGNNFIIKSLSKKELKQKLKGEQK
jgi:hypothetical protein